ncbi:putative Ig domain-containing protein [Pyxidicoccus sp. 3LG]
MFKSRRARNAVIGTALWLVSGCQSSSFVSHEERVQGGGSVPLELKSTFAGGNQSDVDGQLVACIALPTGWAAPSASYTFNGGERTDAQASAEVATEAQTAHAVTGAAWHCFVSARMTIPGTSPSTATAALTLPVPAVAQGAYKLEYVTGVRAVESSEGEPTYAAASFSGRLQRLLHVNEAPATTFDHWADSSYGAEGPAALASRAWYGNGRFLAIAEESGLLSSTDGREWTRLSPTVEGTEDAIAVDHLVFAQGKWFGLSDGVIFSSANDGQTWSSAYRDPAPEGSAEGRQFLALAANGARLVATGRAGLIAVTSDGTTWTDQSADPAWFFPRVVAGQNTFIAVGESESGTDTGSILVRQNAEGTAWDVLESPALAGREIAQLVAGNGRFLAFAWKHSEEPPPAALGGEPPPEEPAGIVYRSVDQGTTWTKVEGLVAPGEASLPESVLLAFVDRSFVVAATAAEVVTGAPLAPLTLEISADGVNWTSHSTGAAAAFTADSFATGEQAVVAVSEELSLVATRRPWAKPQITTEALPVGVVGTAYSAELAASGPGGEKTFTVEGTLPAGLSLADGTISGTPTAEGTAAITLVATDARSESASRALNLTVVRQLTSAGAATRRTSSRRAAASKRASPPTAAWLPIRGATPAPSRA